MNFIYSHSLGPADRSHRLSISLVCVLEMPKPHWTGKKQQTKHQRAALERQQQKRNVEHEEKKNENKTEWIMDIMVLQHFKRIIIIMKGSRALRDPKRNLLIERSSACIGTAHTNTPLCRWERKEKWKNEHPTSKSGRKTSERKKRTNERTNEEKWKMKI